MSKFEIHTNAEAALFEGHEREVEIRARLEEYTDSELLDMFRITNSVNGSNDWCDTFSQYEIDELFSNMKPSDIADAFVGVGTLAGLLRYNGYGNLESVTEDELETEARTYCGDLVYHVANDYRDFYDTLTQDDIDLLDFWDDLDRADDDEEREELIADFIG